MEETRSHRSIRPPRWVAVMSLATVAVFVIGCASFTARNTSSHFGRPGANDSVDAYGDAAEALAASRGCMDCHDGIDSMSMHPTGVNIGCAQCHGGDPDVRLPEGAARGDDAWQATMEAAHVAPEFPEQWDNASGNPKNSYALLNRESLEYVRFVNPGDLRIAHITCGGCHDEHVRVVPTSIMAHSAMVPGSGLYNNGVAPFKNYKVGEFYSPDGRSASAQMDHELTEAEIADGVVPSLIPVPRLNISQPGNVFRAAERGIAATRGLGTEFKVDFAHIVVTKTRLNDPYLWFLGTNDYAGSYRSSGCTACHVLYANDDGPSSEHIAKHGYRGTSSSGDPNIPKDRPGHPIKHVFTTAIPSSQCNVCHSHQGSGAEANYAGVMWWDGETDGEQFYRADGTLKQGYDITDVHIAANKDAKHLQFEPVHRSGWSFRKVYKRTVEGQLVGKDGNLVSWDDPDWANKAVHLVDAHFEAGMHCVDCHTTRDVHGDGRLYGEMINATEIACVDCHGTVKDAATFKASNHTSQEGTDMLAPENDTPWKQPQFYTKTENGRTIYMQRSKVVKDREWVVPQVKDIIDPSYSGYNKLADVAKTLTKGDNTWGDPSVPEHEMAHSSGQMECYACHSSWFTSCSGCHLAQKSNRRTRALHFFGEPSFNDIGYYSQGLRHDSFILGKSGTVQGNKISPVRSASAPVLTVENGARAVVVHQQPTVAASGHSGTAFSPFPPHTISTTHGQPCSACHISRADDNNAKLATLFNMGTHATDFIGTYVHLATAGAGVTAVRVTDGWDPQPVIGSDFHKMTNPGLHAAHLARGGVLTEAHGHSSSHANDIQHRGEYLFIADGPGGFRVFDIANIANKDAAQRIISAPFSPLGHDAHVPTQNATAVVLPTTAPMDPPRVQDPANQETPVHPLFGYAYVLDSVEGLVVVDVNTFINSNPDDNDIRRNATWNPDGVLTGAHHGLVVGNYLYALTTDALVVVNIDEPTRPALVTTVGLNGPRGIDVQFRYAAVTDRDGMKVLDITDLERPALVEGALVPMSDARGVRMTRTYAYVAAGKDGLAIVDCRTFRKPVLAEMFNADGAISDATEVVTGLTNASQFAYIADGTAGLKVVALWEPSRTSGTDGYSPRPTPRLVASYPTDGAAVAISTGIIRDRGCDESGNQIGVYGRLGSRPMNLAERQRFYLKDGRIYTVTDHAAGYTERR